MRNREGFTFIELMITVLLIAGLVMFSIPKYKELQKRQNTQQSGQNLRQLNMAVVQWGVENFGPPDPSKTPLSQATNSLQFLVPFDQPNHEFCKAILLYLPAGFHAWSSPSRPGTSAYVYQTWADAGLNLLRAGCFSVLDANSNYEPDGYRNITVTTPLGSVKAAYANGYEDAGLWYPGTPRNFYDLDTLGSSEDYP